MVWGLVTHPVEFLGVWEPVPQNALGFSWGDFNYSPSGNWLQLQRNPVVEACKDYSVNVTIETSVTFEHLKHRSISLSSMP